MNARALAEEITKGDLKNQHIGTKTPEVFGQELFSLLNSYKPQTMTETESISWEDTFTRLIEEIHLSDGDSNVLQVVLDKIREYQNYINKNN